MLLQLTESEEERIERLRPKTLPEARIEHLREVLVRKQNNRYDVGTIVTMTKDGCIDAAYLGEPHIVMEIRAKDAHECEWGCTHLIATVDANGLIQVAWVEQWRLEKWVPKSE